MKLILSNSVLWSFDYEVSQRDSYREAVAHFSGVPPFYCHSGTITLTDKSIAIEGDLELSISLSDLDQLYLGFDEIYPRTLVKNFGIFWDPLRIKYFGAGRVSTIYLIIGYNGLIAQNKKWFNAIISLINQS